MTKAEALMKLAELLSKTVLQAEYAYDLLGHTKMKKAQKREIASAFYNLRAAAYDVLDTQYEDTGENR